VDALVSDECTVAVQMRQYLGGPEREHARVPGQYQGLCKDDLGGGQGDADVCAGQFIDREIGSQSLVPEGCQGLSHVLEW
jgi:hypothetical protein